MYSWCFATDRDTIFFSYSFDPGEVRVGFQLQLRILGYVVVTTDAIEGVLFLSSPPLWI